MIHNPLGTLQTEALFIAHHGPLGMVKRYRSQATALAKKGYLDADLRPTEKGRETYVYLTTPQSWSHCPLSKAWGLSNYFATLSEDGETAYVARHGSKEPALAIVAQTIPLHASEVLGLAPVGVAA